MWTAGTKAVCAVRWNHPLTRHPMIAVATRTPAKWNAPDVPGPGHLLHTKDEVTLHDSLRLPPFNEGRIQWRSARHYLSSGSLEPLTDDREVKTKKTPRLATMRSHAEKVVSCVWTPRR